MAELAIFIGKWFVLIWKQKTFHASRPDMGSMAVLTIGAGNIKSLVRGSHGGCCFVALAA